MYLPSWDIPEANLRWYIWMLIQGSQEKKRQTWDIVYIIIRRLYITLLRGRLLFLFFVNGQLLWYFNINFIKKRFIASWCFRTLHTDPELKQNRLPQHFFPNLTYANLWHFATGRDETVYFVKTNLEYPDFLFHILLI